MTANKCHKNYLSGPLGKFCLYVILTISYLRAQTTEASSLPTDSSQPLFKQIEIFSILTVWLYISAVLSLKCTRELLECLLGISPSGRNPCGGNKSMINKRRITYLWYIVALLPQKRFQLSDFEWLWVRRWLFLMRTQTHSKLLKKPLLRQMDDYV